MRRCLLIAWTATMLSMVCKDSLLALLPCPAPLTGSTTITVRILDEKGGLIEPAHGFVFLGAPSDLAVAGTINHYLWMLQYPVPTAPVAAPSVIYTK